MIVSVVIPSFYPAVVYGGTIHASLYNARSLAALGHQVYVSTTNTNMHSRLNVPSGKFLETGKNIFVKYYNETIVDKFSLPLFLGLHKDLKRADLIHIQAIFNTPIPLALYFARRYGKTVWLSPHGVLGSWVMNNGSAWKKLWLQLFIKPFAEYVYWLATSLQEKREILFHFPTAKVIIIPIAVELDEFKRVNKLSKESFLIKFGNTSGKPEKILVTMARLQKKKGIDILIRAFDKVRKEIPGAYLFIAGQDEGEKENLMHLAAQLGLNGRIIFTGNLEGEDKVDFLSNADLFILPSHNENFGIVYAEALAAGTPVVASRETPWEEVETFGCGKWVPNTVQDNTEAILEMLNRQDGDVRSRAQAYAKKFSFEEVSQGFDKAIQLTRKSNA